MTDDARSHNDKTLTITLSGEVAKRFATDLRDLAAWCAAQSGYQRAYNQCDAVLASIETVCAALDVAEAAAPRRQTAAPPRPWADAYAARQGAL